MNAAARIVILAMVGLAYVAVVCYAVVATRRGDIAALDKLSLLILGYLAGVLARTGYGEGGVGPVEGSTINVVDAPDGPKRGP